MLNVCDLFTLLELLSRKEWLLATLLSKSMMISWDSLELAFEAF